MRVRLLAGGALWLAAAVAFAAGRSEPIENFSDLPAKTQGDTPSASQVRAAIITAGRKRNWLMMDGEPGVLVATLLVRAKHKAVVDITYSPRSFSVVYRDSENLNYDGHEIHNAYNRWVRDLVFNISSVLALVEGNASAVVSTPGLRPASAPAPTASRGAEVAFWESVRDSKKPGELQAYLDQYPNGIFAPLARARLADLRAAKP